jgi:hypothetical protein
MIGVIIKKKLIPFYPRLFLRLPPPPLRWYYLIDLSDKEVSLKYAALLRGINVGKSVQVPMAALKNLFEGLGLSFVATYLNSGNVIFESKRESSYLRELIEGALEKAFGQRIPTLVKTSSEMISIAESIPAEWGNSEKEQTYVAYLSRKRPGPRSSMSSP